MEDGGVEVSVEGEEEAPGGDVAAGGGVESGGVDGGVMASEGRGGRAGGIGVWSISCSKAKFRLLIE